MKREKGLATKFSGHSDKSERDAFEIFKILERSRDPAVTCFATSDSHFPPNRRDHDETAFTPVSRFGKGLTGTLR